MLTRQNKEKQNNQLFLYQRADHNALQHQPNRTTNMQMRLPDNISKKTKHQTRYYNERP